MTVVSLNGCRREGVQGVDLGEREIGMGVLIHGNGMETAEENQCAAGNVAVESWVGPGQQGVLQLLPRFPQQTPSYTMISSWTVEREELINTHPLQAGTSSTAGGAFLTAFLVDLLLITYVKGMVVWPCTGQFTQLHVPAAAQLIAFHCTTCTVSTCSYH